VRASVPQELEPRVTFAHVFFDAAFHGREHARALAEYEGFALNRERAAFADAERRGDTFAGGAHVVAHGPEIVASRFGPDMARRVFELAPDPGAWHGPFASPEGFHLVMVTGRE